MINVVRILINGEMNDTEIDADNNLFDELESISNDKGYNQISFLYEWNYDNYYVKIYGGNDGDINKTNSHNLPGNGNDIKSLSIDSDEITLYGDIIIVKTDIDNKYCDILSEEYGEFYNVVYNYKDSDTNSDPDTEESYTSDESIDYDTLDELNGEVIPTNKNAEGGDIASKDKSILVKLKSKGKKKPVNKYIGNILNRDNNSYKELKFE